MIAREELQLNAGLERERELPAMSNPGSNSG